MILSLSPHHAAIVLRTGRHCSQATAPSPSFGHLARPLSSAPNRLDRANNGDPRRGVVNSDDGSSGNKSADDHEPWWSLASLHRRVATIIATSLPKEGISAVHGALSEKLGRSSPSIDEAIAGARAREAHHQSRQSSADPAAADPRRVETQRKMEEDMECRVLEKARERVELELRQLRHKERERAEGERRREAAFERWKEDTARERRREEEERGRADGLRTPVHDVNIVQKSQETSALVHHPILGPQIALLPYKRVHLTSATTLASLPVYEKQRAYRHDRAKAMAKDKKKTLWMGMPGVISLMEDDDGRLSIVDGQHRVGMMSLLREEQLRIREKRIGGSGINSGGGSNNNNANKELAKLDLENILVEVLLPRGANSSHDGDDGDSVLGNGQKQAEQDDMASIFTEINKAEPVKILDLPGVANKRTRDIIDHAASHFHDAFPAMFSSSQRCRVPHLNLDNLREALFASEVIRREAIGSGGELVRWMANRNDELRTRYGSVDVGACENGEGKRVSEVALKKARKHDFYLGLEVTWLYK